MNDRIAREQLQELLEGGGAHLPFSQAVADIPSDLRGARIKHVSHTIWRLVEHLRICQWDILEFSRNPYHVSPPFPDGLWPEGDAPPTEAAWEETLERFQADLDAMIELVLDPRTDLWAPIPHGEGQTIFREALLVADHNAYHLGQLILLRRALGIWDD